MRHDFLNCGQLAVFMGCEYDREAQTLKAALWALASVATIAPGLRIEGDGFWYVIEITDDLKTFTTISGTHRTFVVKSHGSGPILQ
jgi:hypothetical protein